MKNIIFKEIIGFIAIIILFCSCGFFQDELPSIKIECSTNKISVLDKNYCIDSIVLKNYNSESSFFAIKTNTTDSIFEVNMGDSNLLFKKYGSFNKSCQEKNLELSIFIRDLRVKKQPLSCGVNYKCYQDSVIITKPDGKI